MDRRRFLARAGLLTAGGVAGAGVGFAAEQVLAEESPTARTARPAGPAPFVATATFRTEPSARLIALTIDDGPTREWTPQVLKILQRHGARRRSSESASGRRQLLTWWCRPRMRVTNRVTTPGRTPI